MRRVAFLLAGTLCALLASAQDKPNFSGTWVLDIAASDFGQFPTPDSQVEVIEHHEPNIKLTRTMKSEAIPGGGGTIQRSYTTDGKENKDESGPRPMTSTSNWEKSALVTLTKIEIPDGKMEIKESWLMAPDGKQMTVTREFNGPMGESAQKLVFNRQK
jgi:hypothetical protein